MSTKKKFDDHPMAQYWHPTKNGDTKPYMVSYGSAKKCWFKCPNEKCLHDFITNPNHVTKLTNPTWCPYCCQAPKKLCDAKDCNICYEKSFASHPMSNLWCQETNGSITPRDIFVSSNKTYWFKCDDSSCKHLFDISINSITCKNTRCPYCAHKRLCEDNDCEPCMRRSFAYHPRSKNWDHEKNGDITPRSVFKNSGDISYWFICDNNHSFSDNLGHITSKEARWCGKCSKNIEIQFRSEKYIVEVREIAKKLGGDLISTVYVNAHKLLEFKCKDNHTWEASYDSVSRGSWCPKCVNKTEQKLYESLSQIYPILETQYKVDWCKKISYLPFDFVLKLLKIIIELDGRQHFIQVSNWKSPEETQKVDLYKMKCANENGFSVIRILQEDVYYDIGDWLSQLVTSIKKIEEENIVQNIYLCKNNEYEHYNL